MHLGHLYRSAILCSWWLPFILLIRWTFQRPSAERDAPDPRVRNALVHHPRFVFEPNQSIDVRWKTILLWNSWFHMDESFFFGTGHEPFVDAGCPVSDCYVSNKRNAMPPSEYDAILFFFPTLKSVPFVYSRKSSQVYVFVNEEPPFKFSSDGILNDFNGFFNLTMTYRTDSDIRWPYGSVQRAEAFGSHSARDGDNYARRKSKLVAWFVSNCRTESRREEYVRELGKYVKVDVYGKCSDDDQLEPCWSTDDCYRMLEHDYKFYLSFENSLCRDYVTEKFFEILNRDVVAVVLGAANYSALVPAGSYIDANRLEPSALAQLLLDIDQDDRLYNEFFAWKRQGYQVKHKRRQMARQAFCQLCRYLHQSHESQVYWDLGAWWGPEGHCQIVGTEQSLV